MKIRIIGAGCPRCSETEMNVISACSELGILADISHVWDQGELRKYKVTGVPTIVVDEKVLMTGRVPTVHELKRLLSSVEK